MTNVDRVTEVPNRAARGELREPADLVVPEGGAEGEIVAACDHLGGSPCFVQDGRLKHTYSMMVMLVYTQEAEEPQGGAARVRWRDRRL